MFIFFHAGFEIEAGKAKSVLRKAAVVASNKPACASKGPTPVVVLPGFVDTEIIPTAIRSDNSKGFCKTDPDLIPWRGKDARHAGDGYDQDGLFGNCTSSACCRFARRQPKPPAVVIGGRVVDGMGRAEAARNGGMDRQSCAIGFIVSTPKARTVSRIFAPKAMRPDWLQSDWRPWRRSSRPSQSGQKTASCAGDGIELEACRRGGASASSITSVRSANFWIILGFSHISAQTASSRSEGPRW